MLRPVCGFKGH